MFERVLVTVRTFVLYLQVGCDVGQCVACGVDSFDCFGEVNFSVVELPLHVGQDFGDAFEVLDFCVDVHGGSFRSCANAFTIGYAAEDCPH